MNEPPREYIGNKIRKDPRLPILIPPQHQVEVDELIVALLLELGIGAEHEAVVAPCMTARADAIGQDRVAPRERTVDDPPIVGTILLRRRDVGEFLILVEMDEDRTSWWIIRLDLSSSTATLSGVPMSVFVSRISSEQFAIVMMQESPIGVQSALIRTWRSPSDAQSARLPWNTSLAVSSATNVCKRSSISSIPSSRATSPDDDSF